MHGGGGLKRSRPMLECTAIEDKEEKKKENNMNKVRAVHIYTYIYVIIEGHSRYWVLAVAYLAYG